MKMRTAFLVLTAVAQIIATAPKAVASQPRQVAVCLDADNDIGNALLSARRLASSIFKDAGITVKWHARNCPSGAIQISIVQSDPPRERPDGAAYALIPEREIVIFFNRLMRTVELQRLGSLLAHVIVHEMTHILQGFDRHSANGVMKTNWSQQDYERIAIAGLTFTKEDIELIHRGMDRQSEEPWGIQQGSIR